MAKIVISGMADDKLLDKFIGDWNNADKTASRLKQIYIDSPGGQTAIYYIIQDIINSQSDKCTLIACGELHSAAFEMFYSVKCRKVILPFTFGMYHFATDEIQIDEKGKPKENYAKARLENLKLTKNFTLNFCKKIGMNAIEIRRIKAGEDVYFQTDRLNYFLKQIR